MAEIEKVERYPMPEFLDMRIRRTDDDVEMIVSFTIGPKRLQGVCSLAGLTQLKQALRQLAIETINTRLAEEGYTVVP